MEDERKQMHLHDLQGKQIYFEYDQNNRVLSTIDSQNRKQLFFYKQNGLLNNVYTYNGNGALEVEFLFKYTYHE